METVRQDLRYAARKLLKSPGFAAVAVLTLALGIGASTALFSVVDALLLRPLPLHEPHRLVRLEPEVESGLPLQSFSYPQYIALRSETRALSGLVASAGYEFSFRDGGRTRVLGGRFVSGNYFDVLGVRPAAGRFFVPDRERPGGAPVVVLSHDLWRSRYGADPALVGRTVSLNGQPFTVIGVAPKGFKTRRVGASGPALWVPLATYSRFEPGEDLSAGRLFFLSLTGRLKQGVSAARAEAALSGLAREHPGFEFGPRLAGVALRGMDPIEASLRGRVLNYLALLAIATGLVLLIAGVNVAGMLLARAAGRRREIAIRMAMGAGRRRVIRQLLTEGALLFLLGGAGGLLLASWITGILTAVPWPVPVQLEPGLDWRVLGFGLLLSLLTGVGFSLLPALQASRRAALPELKQGGARTGRRGSPMRGGLVVVQVALSVLLLVGAGLFLRALQSAWSIDPGFDPDGVYVASFDLSNYGYSEVAGRQFYETLIERVRTLPSVESAALAERPPFGSASAMMSIEIEGRAPPPGEPPPFVAFNVVSAGYFRTMEIPLLRGRSFAEAAREGGSQAAIINRAMAEQYWQGEDAVGKRIDGRTVVGVVGNIKTGSLEAEPRPRMYLPFSQQYSGAMALHFRTRGEPAPVFAAVRAETRSLDENLPPLTIRPLSDLIGVTLLPQRMGAVLLGSFGLFGLLLAALGIYGLLAYAVAQRTREIGIRLALGAERSDVLRLVIRRGAILTLAGLALGVIAALAATRVLAGLLYGVSTTDPATFVAVSAALGAVALAASYIPARRATRVDPMTALRHE